MGGSASTEWSTSEISGSGADTDGSPRSRPRRSCPIQSLKPPFALILHSSQGESKPLPLKIVHALSGARSVHSRRLDRGPQARVERPYSLRKAANHSLRKAANR